MNPSIRKATEKDICRMAEIEVFNYRMNFYPIFRNDWYYFHELQVAALMEQYRQEPTLLDKTYVYDDGVVKAMICADKECISKFFVEPVLQNQGIGSQLLHYVLSHTTASCLWVLEKNHKAIRFYERHGFRLTDEKKLEEDTTEYLIKMTRSL